MYAFFLDIDGTIYDGKQVADEVIDAMARARAAGHKVFINTARAYIGMPEQVYGLPLDGVIGSYGTEIFADGGFVFRRFIPRERVIEIARYAFERGRELYFEGEIRIDINRHREGGLNPTDICEFERMLGDNGICKFVLLGGASDEEKAAFFPDFDFYGIEVAPRGYTKARGIEFIEKHYGISRENTVAIGDSDPDIDMISYAGIGISMGNGTTGLKECARYVTKSYKEYGVAYAIDRILEDDLEALTK